MQTFLAYADFALSAKVLDGKRLNKERPEVLEIYNTITIPSYGWQHHPAVTMWRGYEQCLLEYGIAICTEWIRRGFKDNLLPVFLSLRNSEIAERPWWLGNEAFHSAHRAILLAKNFEHYSKFGWTEKPAVKINGKWPYVWPKGKS
jgi:hypothetical protein